MTGDEAIALIEAATDSCARCSDATPAANTGAWQSGDWPDVAEEVLGAPVILVSLGPTVNDKHAAAALRRPECRGRIRL